MSGIVKVDILMRLEMLVGPKMRLAWSWVRLIMQAEDISIALRSMNVFLYKEREVE